jgi:Concanavalin A-like lectin/glucanases superfamily
MALMSKLFLLAAGLLVTGCGAAPLDAVTVDPRSLSMGLVAHWTFDEGSGPTVVDHSGNGRDGALTGGTWTGSGRFGGALQLALGDNVTFSPFPQATPNWTISAWVKMSEAQLTTNVGTADFGTILSTEIAFSGGWELQLNNPKDKFAAAYWVGPTSGGDGSMSSEDGSTPSGSYVIDDCQCVVADRWIHLTAVFDDDAQQFTLYQNDAVVERMMTPGPIQSGDSTLCIGKWSLDGRFLAADLDDFAIWNRALSAGEVAVISQQPPPD